MQITEKNIVELFDNLWPGMPYVQTHRAACLSNLAAINNCFKKFRDHNQLLNSLCSIENIGLTIASGLIWSAFPKTRVPFDRYTLAFAIEQGVLKSEKISSNYIECCEKIKHFCDGFINDETSEVYSIKDFVREALIVAEDLEYEPLNPK